MVRVEVYARGQYLMTLRPKDAATARVLVATLPSHYRGLLIY